MNCCITCIHVQTTLRACFFLVLILYVLCSTASSICFNTARPPTIPPEKSFIRPKSTGFPLQTSSNFTKNANLKPKLSTSEALLTSENSTPLKTGNCYVIKEHVIAEQTNSFPPSRQSYFTSAFRVTSAAFSKRPQAS